MSTSRDRLSSEGDEFQPGYEENEDPGIGVLLGKIGYVTGIIALAIVIGGVALLARFVF